MRAGLISSYPPRQCGIGEFTHSLWTWLAKTHPEEPSPIVVAMNTPAAADLDYPPEVRFEVGRDNHRDYRQAAQFLNSSNVDVVCVQHEYGLFGGDWGLMLSDLLRRLERPIVTAMHTVLEDPPKAARRATQQLIELSAKLVVLSRVAAKLLCEVYAAPAERIVHVPHGAPDRPFLDPSYFKPKYNMAGRRVILTFGLLGPGKGLELAITAMRKVAEAHPNILYVIAGATHPEEKKRWGERYRISLQRLAEELGLTEHVQFVNRFLDTEELCEYLHAADIYVTPYPNREQISSGTLTYALALGKAIVSTNYYYAEELLADGRGVVVPAGDQDALADGLIRLLSDEVYRDELRRRAYEHGRKMIWPEVARQYRQVFEQAMSGFVRRVRRVPGPSPVRGGVLPDLKLDYMMTLTDDVGILEGGRFQTPEWSRGYRTDDNARALIVAIRNRHTLRWDAHRYITKYLAFLYNAQRSDGTFHASLSFDRKWSKETGTEDCVGRAVWATGMAVRYVDHRPHEMMAKQIFDRALPIVRKLRNLRAKAYSMQGLAEYLHVFAGARDVRLCMRKLADDLLKAYRRTASEEWQWFENILTYSNGNLVFALLTAAEVLEDEHCLQVALESLDFLDRQCWDAGRLSLIGNEGWFPRGGPRAKFSQLPMDAASMVRAYNAAYLVTGKTEYLDKMRRSFEWFVGNNDLGAVLADLEQGACADSLDHTGVNPNYGAAATLAYLSALSFVQESKDVVPVDEEFAAPPATEAASPVAER